jgi:hypothetical protein
VASILTLVYTRGDISTLVLMYSINVFLTFSLSESGMIRYWFLHRAKYPDWGRHIVIHLIGFVLCFTILVVSIVEKFTEGGWITLIITSALIALCYLIRSRYDRANQGLKRLDETLMNIPFQPDLAPLPEVDRSAPTAVVLVRNFDGLGLHALLTIPRLFRNYFKKVVFISVGVIDSARFKGADELENLKCSTEENLKSYVEYANCLGWPAESRYSIGVGLLDELEKVSKATAKEFPGAVFFAAKLVFERESFFTRLLHNRTPYALERRLQFEGIHLVILPVRIFDYKSAGTLESKLAPAAPDLRDAPASVGNR